MPESTLTEMHSNCKVAVTIRITIRNEPVQHGSVPLLLVMSHSFCCLSVAVVTLYPGHGIPSRVKGGLQEMRTVVELMKVVIEGH